MIRFLLALAPLLAVTALPLQASPLAQSAEPFFVGAVQSISTGAFFLTKGSSTWPLVPDSITDDELASLAIADSSSTVLIDPRLAPPPLTRAVRASDGTLYITFQGSRWNTAFPLVPDQIGDADVAALNLGTEIDGTIPTDLVKDTTQAAPQPQSASSAPAATATPAQAAGGSAVQAPVACAGGIPGIAWDPGVNVTCVRISVGQPVTSTIDRSNPRLHTAVEGAPRGDEYGVILGKNKTYELDFTSDNLYGRTGGGVGLGSGAMSQQMFTEVYGEVQPIAAGARIVSRPEHVVYWWVRAFPKGGNYCGDLRTPDPRTGDAGPFPDVNECVFTALQDAEYYVTVQTGNPGARYILTIKQLS